MNSACYKRLREADGFDPRRVRACRILSIGSGYVGLLSILFSIIPFSWVLYCLNVEIGYSMACKPCWDTIRLP